MRGPAPAYNTTPRVGDEQAGSALSRVGVVAQRDGFVSVRRDTQCRGQRGRTVGLAISPGTPFLIPPIAKVRSLTSTCARGRRGCHFIFLQAGSELSVSC